MTAGYVSDPGWVGSSCPTRPHWSAADLSAALKLNAMTDVLRNFSTLCLNQLVKTFFPKAGHVPTLLCWNTTCKYQTPPSADAWGQCLSLPQRVQCGLQQMAEPPHLYPPGCLIWSAGVNLLVYGRDSIQMWVGSSTAEQTVTVFSTAWHV